MNFEIMPFALGSAGEAPASLSYEGEDEAPRRAAPRRYVKDFSGPAAECVTALRRAGTTRAKALATINEQIGVAIKMLRKAAADLERGKRSKATRDLFLKIFRVRPEFVPKDWFKPTASIKDRGDVVRVRCARVAAMLAGGRIRYFCAINGTNCPACATASPASPGCSSFGGSGAAARSSLVICLGTQFWDMMKADSTDEVLAVLMHEPFHIYFGQYVTEHQGDNPRHSNVGKFGGVYCIARFVFETNRRTAPTWTNDRCEGTPVRRELETAWS
jgi:hypothetical protein